MNDDRDPHELVRGVEDALIDVGVVQEDDGITHLVGLRIEGTVIGGTAADARRLAADLLNAADAVELLNH